MVAAMQASKQRILNDPYLIDALAEQKLERRAHRIGHWNFAADFHGASMIMGRV